LLGVEEGCCGFPLFTIGYRDEFIEEARKNVEKISSENIGRLVTVCPACYRTFRELYAHVEALSIEILHISEFIKELIEAGRIKFKELPLTITYHDPCHLGRHMGLYDQPRDVIRSIPGIKLVEMTKNKAESRCCGAGGALRFSFPVLSTSIAATKVRLDIAPTKAEALVTACPACVRNLKDGITKAEVLYGIEKIEVLDLVQLVARALK
jgi:Fe-S oxidoreductase